MAYGLQIFNEAGSLVLDTSTFTVKDRELYANASITANASIPIPGASADSVVSVVSNNGPNSPIPSATISGSTLTISGSGFNVGVRVVDYR
tara:strand:- start:163 stop:435 length:273 start_codon:yes stop_codon:yes gene_type:complete